MNDYWLAVVLGVVEGLTEFLPISSTGHLLLTEQLLDIDLENDSFWKMFTVVIQLGAILGVVVFYAPRLRALLADFVSPTVSYGLLRWRHPLVLVLAAVVPARLLGLLFKKQIDQVMEHALPVGLALVVGGVLIELIERLRHGRDRVTDVSQVSPLQALAIGVAQAVALIPGVSRSAATIMGGRLCGLNTYAAADFSFLLSIPTMIAAALYSLYKHQVPLDAQEWTVLAIGFGVSFVVGLAVVAWFLHYLRSHGMRLFVIYRLLVGTAVIVAALNGALK